MNDFKIISPLDADTPIYRFLSFPALMTMLEKSTMPLRKVTEWEDVWELPMRHLAGIKDEDLEEKLKGYKVYGISWTRLLDSDALWRIYSQDRMGVCISSTVGLLKKAVIKRNTAINACIAEIVYDDEANFILSELFGRKYSQIYPAPYTGACIKRPAFSHEQEVRFMVHATEVSKPTPSFFYVQNIDARNFIKEIIFDPRAEEWYVATMSAYLQRFKISCRKSSLYTVKKLDIEIKANLTEKHISKPSKS